MLVVERVADVFKNRNIIYGELELGGLLSIYLLLLVEAWLGREDRGGVDLGTGSEGTLSRGALFSAQKPTCSPLTNPSLATVCSQREP